MQCNVMQCNAIQRNTTQHNAKQGNAMQCSAVQCSTVQSSEVAEEKKFLKKKCAEQLFYFGHYANSMEFFFTLAVSVKFIQNFSFHSRNPKGMQLLSPIYVYV